MNEETKSATNDGTNTPSDTNMADNSTAETPIPLHRNREYRWWLTGEIARDFGSSIGSFAFPLITLAITHSPSLTGTVAFFGGLGKLIALIPGGVIADRYNRRNLRLLSTFLGALLQIILLAVLLTGIANWWILALIAIVDSFRSGLLGVSSTALLKQVVNDKQLPKALAVNQGRNAAISMAGSPIGGVLLGIATTLPVVVDLICYAFANIATFFMRGKYRILKADDKPKTSAFAEAKEGVAWIFQERVRIDVTIMGLFINFAINGTLWTLTIWLASQGLQPGLIGMLNTFLMAAILVGSIVAGKVVGKYKTGSITIVAILIISAVAAALPFVEGNYVATAVCMFILGLPLTSANSAIGGYFMHLIPNEMQGRVLSAQAVMSTALMPLGPALAGWGLSWVGGHVTMIGFALVAAGSALFALASKPIRSIPVASEW